MFVEASGGGSVKKVLEPKITTRDEGLVVILGSKTERSLGGRKSFNSLRAKLGRELNRASQYVVSTTNAMRAHRATDRTTNRRDNTSATNQHTLTTTHLKILLY